MNRFIRVRRSCRVGSVAVLAMAAGRAAGQCGSPALYEFGGMPGPVCTASSGVQVGYEAVARGRYINIESSPLVSGSPAVMGRVALDHPARFMHTEIVGRVWATDGSTIYGLNTGTPASPQILGRITIPNARYISRLRIRGNYVYAVEPFTLYIVDVTNPAAPVLRSTLTFASSPFVHDVEVIGSYAYLSMEESADVNSLIVVDVSSPTAPVEVRRVGSNGRRGYRVAKAPNLAGLYTLAWNSTSAAIEEWSLATPSNPSLAAANVSLSSDDVLDYDDLRATNTAICFMGHYPAQVRLYDPGALGQIGPTLALPYGDFVNQLGTDTPYAFITRQSGELTRVNINTNPMTPQDPFLDIVPGYTRKVLDIGTGISVLTGSNDLWFFVTPNGAAPYSFAHVKGDAGYVLGGDSMALLSDGTLFAIESSTTSLTALVLAYHVTGAPSPSVQAMGSYPAGAYINGMDAGYDASNVRRVYYTTGGGAGGSPFLHVLNATNLAAMTHDSAFALTSTVYTPVRFFSASSFPPAPARVLVGGGATQIVSVASAGAPSSLGVIPSASQAIVRGLSPTMWLIDQNRLKAYDISTPATPVLQSAIRIAPDQHSGGVDVKTTSPFGNALALTTGDGDLVEVQAASANAPVITQIGRLNSANGPVNGLSWDGTNLHVANGIDGYMVMPVTFTAPPREDPNNALGLIGNAGIAAICVGTPFTATAHFVANPAVSAYQWLKLTGSVFTPLADGPTGTGSTVSGAATATLTITNPGPADAGYFSCRATNSCGTATTDTLLSARLGGYPNCDQSTVAPVLNVNDFICFLNAFAAGDPYYPFQYANCDGSSLVPVLNVNDFVCFLNLFAAGCP